MSRRRWEPWAVLRATDTVAYRHPLLGQVSCTACIPFYDAGWEAVFRSERLEVGGRECAGCGRLLIPAPADPVPARRRVVHAEEAA